MSDYVNNFSYYGGSSLLQTFWTASSKREHVYRQLRGLYDEPGRYYHNWNHIQDVLSTSSKLAQLITLDDENLLEVHLALFFHDIIHTTFSYTGTGETESAALAKAVLTNLEVAPAVIERICEYILVTRNHSPVTGSVSEGIVICADLWGLGDVWENYHRVGRLIRKEYGHLDDATFNSGRLQFLLKYGEHVTLYPLNLEICRVRQLQAVNNFTRELNSLPAPARF